MTQKGTGENSDFTLALDGKSGMTQAQCSADGSMDR